MQLSTFITVLAAAGSASAAAAKPSESPKLSGLTEPGEYTLDLNGPGCSPFSCLDILKDAVCIAANIETGDIEGILACVGGDKEALCDCASCIPGLGDLLNNAGIC